MPHRDATTARGRSRLTRLVHPDAPARHFIPNLQIGNRPPPPHVWHQRGTQTMDHTIIHDHEHEDDGVDRRGFLRCMAWAGTGMAWVAGSGVLSSAPLPRPGAG